MTTQHTPGPWHLDNVGIVDANDEPVAFTASMTLGLDTAEANARLIAAAPDLLAAANLAFASLADHMQYDNDDDEQPSLERVAFDALTAAIAKATGND